MRLQQSFRAAVCAIIIALCLFAGLFTTQSAVGQVTEPASLQGAAAIKQLIQDGQYESLQAALNEAVLTEAEEAVTSVEEGEALYPLTIDPDFTFQQKLTAADGDAYDIFGSALALSGDTAVIGAHWDHVPHPYQGSVYVFVRSGNGWTQVQKLTASDGEATDNFGLSVAISDDTIVVGAQVDDIGTTPDQGSVYIFTRNGNEWTEKQKLTASDGEAWDNFGNAVAISGDTIAVGAYEDNIGSNPDQGSVYIFRLSGELWTEKQKLTNVYGQMYDNFGVEVALDDDTMVVGMPFDDMGAFNQGSAHVFARINSEWTFQQYLSAGGVVNQFFGSAVAICGDTIAVGAYGDNVGANDAQGSVYIYARSGTDWMYQAKLTASDGKEWDHFGKAISLNGETLVVGAEYDDIDANQNQGSAYVFKGSGPTWIEQQKLIAHDGEAFEYFGRSVAVNDDTVMVGLPIDDIKPNPYQGSVYVFSRSSCPTLTFAPTNLPAGIIGASYQQQVTVSGGTGAYQFSLIDGALPPGLSLSSSGLLSGTPTTTGDYPFTISATNLSSGCSSSRAYTITITPCLTLEPLTLPEGMVDKEYIVQLMPTGGREPYTIVIEGDLPPGLSLALDGYLIGTPTEDGSFYFRVEITDARGCSNTFERFITILKAD